MIALARTGIEKINSSEVMIIDQLNKVIFIKNIFLGFMNIIDIIKFNDLIIEDAPFK